MNKLCIVTGNVLSEVSSAVIGKIDAKDLNTQHIVVVPDRFSLLAEKTVFKELGITSTININVMGINRLAKNIITDSGLSCLVYSKHQCVMLVRRAIQKVKHNFLCFTSHVSFGLCEEINNTISLLKSSGISADEFCSSILDKSGEIYNKLHDISLIFSEYEKLLNGKMDSATVLETFNNLLETETIFKHTHFYFAGFDSLTKQALMILKNLVKNASSVTIGALLPTNMPNKRIYDTTLYENLQTLCKDENFECTQQNITTTLTNQRLFLHTNLFSYTHKPYVQQNSYASVMACNSMEEELDLICKKILYNVKNNNVKFSDYAVCADASYLPHIKNAFSANNISFYYDDAVEISSTSLVKFVIAALKTIDRHFEELPLMQLLYNPYINLQQTTCMEIETALNYCGINHKNIEKQLANFNQPNLIFFLDAYKNTQTTASGAYFVNFVQNTLSFFNAQEITTNITESLANKEMMMQQKVYMQVPQKFDEILESINETLFDEELSLTEFIEILESAAKSVSIHTVPMAADSVLVGDISTFYGDIKHMIILGANEGVMPFHNDDLGLVSDADIEAMSSKITISPTIQIINKRNKYKLFEICTVASQSLFISYLNYNAEGKSALPAAFATEITNMFNCSCSISQFETYAEENMNIILFNTANEDMLLKEYSKNNSLAPLFKKTLDKLNLKLIMFEKPENKINNALKLFFSKRTTKVSQLEQYLSCPFAHFMSYGLKLTENPKEEISAIDFGNILHRCAEIFVKHNADKLGELEPNFIEKTVNDIFEKTIKSEFPKLYSEENMFVKNAITAEVVRFCMYVNLEQKHSDFRPDIAFLETRFGSEKNKIKIDCGGQSISVVGVIDRVDFCQNFFRVIDYKSGNIKNLDSFSAVYYGINLQIMIYMEAIKQLTGKNIFGGFYLPITNKFIKPDENAFKMQGFFINDANMVLKADKTLNFDNPESMFLDAKVSTSNNNIKLQKIVINSLKGVSLNTMNDMVDYAVEVAKLAISEIAEGNASVSPFKSACDFCPYADICQISENADCQRASEKRFTKSDFMRGKNGIQ